MSEIPLDLFQFEQIKYLDLPDILHLCQVNRTFYSICQNPETWRYLLFRDFHLRYDGEDVKEVYMDAYQRVRMFDIPVSEVTEIARERNLDETLLYLYLGDSGFTLDGDVYRHIEITPEKSLEGMIDMSWPNSKLPENLWVDHLEYDFKNEYLYAEESILNGYIRHSNNIFMDPYDAVLVYNYDNPGRDFRHDFKEVIKKADFERLASEIFIEPYTIPEKLRQDLLNFADNMVPF